MNPTKNWGLIKVLWKGLAVPTLLVAPVVLLLL